MEIKFIGQGLDPESDITAGNYLINSLNNNQYNRFDAFVAFISTGGIRNIQEELKSFKDAGRAVRLFVGVNLNATSKEALEQLLALEVETYVIYSPNSLIYHPKIYTFIGDNNTRAIIGSSNLTEKGLFQNVEASVCIDYNNGDENGDEFLADIYDHFNNIINITHPSCQRLTTEILEILIEANVVLPEAVNRAKSNKISKEFGQKEAKVNTRLQEHFGKLKAKRPPKGYKKSSTKQELVVKEADNEINIVYEAVEFLEGAMWIETGMMTGGSRNILDLSKRGKRNGEVKFGSISFFGLEPDNTEIEKDIDIEFGGKLYKSNHIFYTEGNSNWRIRINGETDDGEKITLFTKPTLGENGGFQNKILIFTLLNNTTYKLEVIDKEEIDKLIENSSDWARGGNGTGRAYGILS